MKKGDKVIVKGDSAFYIKGERFKGVATIDNITSTFSKNDSLHLVDPNGVILWNGSFKTFPHSLVTPFSPNNNIQEMANLLTEYWSAISKKDAIFFLREFYPDAGISAWLAAYKLAYPE